MNMFEHLIVQLIEKRFTKSDGIQQGPGDHAIPLKIWIQI